MQVYNHLPEALTVEPGPAREPRGEPAGVLLLVGAGDLLWIHRPGLEAQRLVVWTLLQVAKTWCKCDTKECVTKLWK